MSFRANHLCRICKGLLSAEFYRCNICADGIFNLCRACFSNDASCNAATHPLRKLRIRKDNVSSLFVLAELHVPDGSRLDVQEEILDWTSPFLHRESFQGEQVCCPQHQALERRWPEKEDGQRKTAAGESAAGERSCQRKKRVGCHLGSFGFPKRTLRDGVKPRQNWVGAGIGGSQTYAQRSQKWSCRESTTPNRPIAQVPSNDRRSLRSAGQNFGQCCQYHEARA